MAIKIEDFIKELKQMKVIELNKLVKAIEEEFGVTASAPVAASAGEAVSTEKTVKLLGPGANKIATIKLVREILGLGLMEAKGFAEKGGVIKEGLDDTEAEALVAKFKEIGADIVAE
ncbi:MAG: 50S ribosomal protein L7/L12 [Mycoplasmataceae bacterium]|nr:50S ribosomal protein L7/L12 [Mycoplasmataceae bacterium]